jgi:hypothetical protein
MQRTLLAAFFEFSRTAFSMSAAVLALLLIGLLAAKNDMAQARGPDKIVALTNLCFAIPLAAFCAEHLSGAKFLTDLVPSYMPWRLFWAYFVGFALIAASLSIGTKTQVRWSGLLFGIMKFLFVAMIHFPGAATSGRGAQLLRRHASIWRSDSFAGPRHDGHPPPSAKFTESMRNSSLRAV